MAATVIGKPRKRRRVRSGPRSGGRLQQAIDRLVEAEIKAALEETHGNVTGAARVLGIHQTSLIRRMATLGIPPDRYRKA
jgi:DNA-binding NtrC family response regulator